MLTQTYRQTHMFTIKWEMSKENILFGLVLSKFKIYIDWFLLFE
jgi:hypothetical protein